MRFLIWFFLLVSPFSVFGLDKIVYQDGDSLEGQFISQDENVVTFSTNGISFQIQKSEVLSIQLDTKTDKFLLAAKQTTDPERKQAYLKKSLDQVGRSAESRYEVYKLLIAAGDLAGAEVRLKAQLTNRNIIDYDAHLLQAIVYLQKALYPEADMEMARVWARDLSQGAWLDYHLIKSWIFAREGNLTSARVSLGLAEKMDKNKAREAFVYFFPSDDYKNFKKKLESTRSEDLTGVSFVESFYTKENLKKNGAVLQSFLYREQKIRRDREAHGILTAIGGGTLLVGVVLGTIFKTTAENVYSNYSLTSDSKTATTLGDSIDNYYTLADAFYYLGESGLLVTSIFGIWTAIDEINYLLLTDKHKKMLLSVTPKINWNKQSLGVELALRF
jgi:hypothetical protein